MKSIQHWSILSQHAARKPKEVSSSDRYSHSLYLQIIQSAVPETVEERKYSIWRKCKLKSIMFLINYSVADRYLQSCRLLSRLLLSAAIFTAVGSFEVGGRPL